LIDESGKQIGIVSLAEALQMAGERNLDLVQVTEKVEPPVCKIMDYGKYRYKEKKKAQESAKKVREVETKSIRLKLGTSQHDLEVKAKQASEFLKEGNRVKIELILRGQAKFLDKNFLRERIERILPLITEVCKIVEGPKPGPTGIHIIIERIKQ
jgi:translation initiation factor IF-3